MLKKLALLSFFVAFFAVGSAGAVYAADSIEDVMNKCQSKRPEWYQCKTDADCVVSLNPCGWPVLGVNQLHKGRSEICTRQAGAFIDCPMWRDTPENKMVARCLEGVCEAIKASEAPVNDVSSDVDSAPSE